VCRRTLPRKNPVRQTISLSAILGGSCLFKDLNWASFLSSVRHRETVASLTALSRSKVVFCARLANGTSKSTVSYCPQSYLIVFYRLVSCAM